MPSRAIDPVEVDYDFVNGRVTYRNADGSSNGPYGAGDIAAIAAARPERALADATALRLTVPDHIRAAINRTGGRNV